MSHQGGQESQPGYIDGISVKISEKYKPPPRINLAVSYSQRLSLNKQIQDHMQLYDFSLEANVKDCIRDIKNSRKVMLDNNRDVLEKIKADRKAQLEASKLKEVDNVTDLDSKSIVQCTCKASQVETSGILYPTYSHILLPTPLVNNNTSQNYTYNASDKSPFNLADFEADTSSPFDNMELKTINDIEELAQVLTKDKTYNSSFNQVYSNFGPLPTTSGCTNCTLPDLTYTTSNIPQRSTTSVLSTCQPISTTMYNDLNGFYYSPNQNFTFASRPDKPNLKVKSYKNIRDISKTLQDTHIPEVKKPEQLDDIYDLLPKNLQQLSKNISSMGFPLARVARACRVLGDDHKKVVEHLLVMAELLDLGFTEKEVSSALLQCNNDRDKALDILIM